MKNINRTQQFIKPCFRRDLGNSHTSLWRKTFISFWIKFNHNSSGILTQWSECKQLIKGLPVVRGIDCKISHWGCWFIQWNLMITPMVKQNINKLHRNVINDQPTLWRGFLCFDKYCSGGVKLIRMKRTKGHSSVLHNEKGNTAVWISVCV